MTSPGSRPFLDSLHRYHNAASVVVTMGGLGMAIAAMGGWSLWAGYLVGFVPTMVVGAVAHVVLDSASEANVR